MKLLHDNILIEKLTTVLSEVIATPSGFTLEVEQKGRVLDTGPGRLTKRGNRIPCDVKPGDIVYFYELAELHKTHRPNEMIISEEKIFFVMDGAHV